MHYFIYAVVIPPVENIWRYIVINLSVYSIVSILMEDHWTFLLHGRFSMSFERKMQNSYLVNNFLIQELQDSFSLHKKGGYHVSFLLVPLILSTFVYQICNANHSTCKLNMFVLKKRLTCDHLFLRRILVLSFK